MILHPTLQGTRTRMPRKGEKENHRLKSADWHGDMLVCSGKNPAEIHIYHFFKMVPSLENKRLEPENGCLEYEEVSFLASSSYFEVPVVSFRQGIVWIAPLPSNGGKLTLKLQ